MENISISVIIPVYNIEKYLPICIDSIVKQTLKSIEIILVDDGCTDSSGEICDDFAKINNNIKIIHKTNGGVSSARNAGIEIAKGQYIVFVDSDDWLDINLLEVLYKKADSYKADFLVSGYVVEWIDKNKKEYIGATSSLFTKDNLDEVFIQLEFNSLSCGSISKLYKRSIIIENDIRFPLDKCWSEDVEFNINYYNKINSIYVDKLKGYHVRRETDLVSLTRRFVPNMFEIEKELFEKRLVILKRANNNVEVYQHFIKKRYASSLMWCLANIYKDDCYLSTCERRGYINLIFKEIKMRALYNYSFSCKFNSFSIIVHGFSNDLILDLILCPLFKLRRIIFTFIHR